MNFSNQTGYIIDEKLYKRIGSTWVIDGFYLAVISPIGLIGFILNLVSFGVLCKVKIKETKLYQYLKIYSLNSSLICLICGLLFTTYSPRYFPDFTNYLVKIFRCRVYGYGMLSLFFFNNLIDILIIIDRISIFINRLKKFRSIKIYIFLPILFILCFFINSSFYFTFEITPNEIFFTSNSMNYCDQTEYGKSRIGSIVNLIVIFIRDILTLIVELICNVLAIYNFYKFKNMSLHKFAITINKNDSSSNLSNIHQKQTNQTPINTTITNTPVNIEQSRIEKRKHATQQLLLMTIILSIFSFLIHLIAAFIFTFLVLIFFEDRLIYFSIVAFGCFSMAFKHFSTIFIFYFFNSNFKKQFNKTFNRI